MVCLGNNEKTLFLYSGFDYESTKRHWLCRGFVWEPKNMRCCFICFCLGVDENTLVLLVLFMVNEHAQFYNGFVLGQRKAMVL